MPAHASQLLPCTLVHNHYAAHALQHLASCQDARGQTLPCCAAKLPAVGPKRAEAIVHAFGESTLKVLNSESAVDRLVGLGGISRRMAYGHQGQVGR